MIHLEHVTYSYPGAAQPALRDVSLAVPAGQFCAVVGPNGAGKSTLALALAGFVPHFYHGRLAGSATVAGLQTVTTPMPDLVRAVGLVFQNPYNQLSGTRFTVREEVAFGLENLGVPRVEMAGRVAAALELTGLAGLEDRSPFGLSGGQMQRVALAAVLVMRPRILVLDEPTSALDPAGSREVLAAVRALASGGGLTVVVVEHKLEWVAEFADRVVALADGQVVADGPPRLVLTDEALAARGLGQTRFTRAARRAAGIGLWPAGLPLPVTLDDAAAGFSAVAPYETAD